LSAWWFVEVDVTRREVVRDVLRVSMIVGPVVGFGDAWLVGGFSERKGVDENAGERARQAAKGHAVVGVLMAGLAGFSYFLE
jgi:hypothetical protein